MNYFAMLSLFEFVVFVGVGFYVFLKDPADKNVRLFGALCAVLAYWALGEFGLRQAHTLDEAATWLRFSALWPLAASVFLHFIIEYTNKNSGSLSVPVLILLYLPALVFSGVELLFGGVMGDAVQKSWGWSFGGSGGEFSGWYFLLVVWGAAVAIAVIARTINFYKEAVDEETKKERLLMVTAVCLLVGVAVLMDTYVRLSKTDMPELSLTAAALVFLMIAIAIHRKQMISLSPMSATRDILLLIPDCFLLVGADHRILMVNPATLAMLGYIREDIVGLPLARVFVPGTGAGAIDTGSVQDGSSMPDPKHRQFLDYNGELVAKDGRHIPVSVSRSQVHAQDGGVAGTIFLARDQTERTKLTEEMRKSEKSNGLYEVARGVAHDFNNLLTIILGKITLGRDLIKGSDELLELFDSAEKAALAGTHLSRQLLMFSRDSELSKTVITVRSTIENTLELALSGSRIKYDFEMSKEVWPVSADEAQLSQVFMNLIINAKQAMSGGGTIRVRCSNAQFTVNDTPVGLGAGDYVQISIVDEGEGIPIANVNKIFEPFFTTKSSGNGLGLPTSYAIIRNHDGQIRVTSREGVGSTFDVFLPACPSRIHETRTFARPTTTVRKSRRILVMDDDDMVRTVTCSLLKTIGYQVTPTRDGGEAIKVYLEASARGERFDLVFMDLTVRGGIGGADAIRRLREIDPDVKAIACSGYSNDDVLARYADYGFSGMLAKPFKIEKMAEEVEKLFGSGT